MRSTGQCPTTWAIGGALASEGFCFDALFVVVVAMWFRRQKSWFSDVFKEKKWNVVRRVVTGLIEFGFLFSDGWHPWNILLTVGSKLVETLRIGPRRGFVHYSLLNFFANFNSLHIFTGRESSLMRLASSSSSSSLLMMRMGKWRIADVCVMWRGIIWIGRWSCSATFFLFLF